MNKREDQSETDTVVVSDDTDKIVSVDVEVKVAGLDTKGLSSNGKVFSINGRKVRCNTRPLSTSEQLYGATACVVCRSLHGACDLMCTTVPRPRRFRQEKT